MIVVMENKSGHIPDMTASQKGFQDQTWFQQGFSRKIYWNGTSQNGIKSKGNLTLLAEMSNSKNQLNEIKIKSQRSDYD